MKKSFSERLKEVMSEQGLKQVDVLNKSKPFQDKLGINLGKSTLSQYVNGIQSPDDKRIYLLAKTLGVSEPYLMGYDVNPAPQNEKARNYIEYRDMAKIPVVGEVAAGLPIEAIENIDEYRYRPVDGLPVEELFYVKVRGDSMSPNIPSESYVLCRKQQDVESGEIAAVLINDDSEAILKKVRKLDSVIMLESINTSYDPIIINGHNTATILGKAVEVTTTL